MGQMFSPPGISADQNQGVSKTTADASPMATPRAKRSLTSMDRRKRLRIGRQISGESHLHPVRSPAVNASFTHRVSVPKPPPQVWTALQVPATWELLGPIDEVTDPVYDDVQLVSFRWRTKAAGRNIEGTATATDASFPQHFKLALDAGEIEGVLEARLAGEDTTQLEVTLRISPKGPLATLFFPAVSQVVGSGFVDHVEEFASSLGE